MRALNKRTGQLEKVYVKALDSNPVGSVMEYLGTIAPKNYLLLDGEIYNINQYPQLANLIKDTFGSYNYFGGNGTTTFGLPDMRGRVPVGVDVRDVDFETIGKTGGNKKHSHNYGFRYAGYYQETIIEGSTETGVLTYDATNNKSSAGHGANIGQVNITTNTSTNEGTKNVTPALYETIGNTSYESSFQPYMCWNFIIKATNTTPTGAHIVDGYSTSTTDGYSCNFINENIIDVVDISSLITKTANVGTIYSLNAYKKGSRCYLNTIFDLNAVGNVFTLDNSVLPKYGEIATGTNYDTNSMATCTARISTNNANISVDVYGAKKDYCALHIEWEI